MKAILKFLGLSKKAEKKAHTYKRIRTYKGDFVKCDNGLSYFIASDLLK